MTSIAGLGVILGIALGIYIGRNFFSPPSASPATSGSPISPSTSSLTVTPTTPRPPKGPNAARTGEDRDEGDEDGSEDEIIPEGLAGVRAGPFEECKLVLVVRTDLGMTKGKIAAQCGHATLACYKTLSKRNPNLVRHWERIGQAKIALKCDSEEELLVLQATAQSLNICAQSIQDAGRTQIAAGSTTVLGIGPAPVRLINQITGHLRLL